MSVAIARPAFDTAPEIDRQPVGVGVSTITIADIGSGTAAGTLGIGERQLFGLQITAGDTVTINANAVVGTGRFPGAELDPVLKVFLPDIPAGDRPEVNLPGAPGGGPFTIAENNNLNMATLDAGVTFTATVTGLHFVSVASRQFTGTAGDFTLSVSGVTNPGTIGLDTIVGGGLNDVFEAIAGADILYGGDGQDILLGGLGADIIYGNRDTDILYGGDGSDTIFAGQNNALNADGTAAIATVLNPATVTFRQVQIGGSESVFGGSGDDVLYGNFGTDVLHGESGADTIFGGQGDDQANGGSENDLLFGNRGNDSLMGNRGNDTLEGGSGNDTMQGNDGNDVFVFNAGSGIDVITGFTDATDIRDGGADVIQVSANLNGNLTTTAVDYLDRVTADALTGEAIINLGTGADGTVNTIQLAGVQADAVTADYFIF